MMPVKILSGFAPLMICLLADVPATPPAGISGWLLNLLYVCGVFFFLIKGIAETKTFFARKPSVDHEMNEVRVNIAGLVSKKDYDAKVEEERLRDVGLEKQISDVRHLVPEEANARRIEDANLRNEIKDAVDRLSQQMKEGFDKVEQQRSTNIGTLHRDLKTTENKLAAVEADNKTTQHKLDQLDGKVEHMPERILNLLRNNPAPRRSS